MLCPQLSFTVLWVWIEFCGTVQVNVKVKVTFNLFKESLKIVFFATESYGSWVMQGQIFTYVIVMFIVKYEDYETW
jgi:uncharacterized membrane protein